MKKITTYFLIVFIGLLLDSANSFVIAQKNVTPPPTPEPPAPDWVSKRPISRSSFIGIGVADKSSASGYQNEAKKNALFDLSSEIKVDISTNSILFTAQNNNQFNENFNSLIKLSNSDNIEGYKLVDTYENDKQYWLYYELDKDEYQNIKLRKKQQLIAKAVNLIDLSFSDEKDGNFTASLKKRIQAFGVLSPYLNEELTFTSANNIKNIFDLSNVIQKQLQTITVVNTKTVTVIKPYQPNYKPLVYKLAIKNNITLSDFPFTIKSENENIKVFESASSNSNGEIEILLKTVKPLNQEVYFTLNPDIEKLMVNDSINKASVSLLKQFIVTSQLKAYAKVAPITISISCLEKNNGKILSQKIIQPLIESKFSGAEVQLIELKDKADFIIEVDADTQKDISSDILNSNYNVQLSVLKINLALRNTLTKEVVYKTEVFDIYGYGNSQETAGLNAYNYDKLKPKLFEAVFFLKRKIINY